MISECFNILCKWECSVKLGCRPRFLKKRKAIKEELGLVSSQKCFVKYKDSGRKFSWEGANAKISVVVG
jgi:hypothetical protein